VARAAAGALVVARLAYCCVEEHKGAETSVAEENGPGGDARVPPLGLCVAGGLGPPAEPRAVHAPRCPRRRPVAHQSTSGRAHEVTWAREWLGRWVRRTVCPALGHTTRQVAWVGSPGKDVGKPKRTWPEDLIDPTSRNRSPAKRSWPCSRPPKSSGARRGRPQIAAIGPGRLRTFELSARMQSTVKPPTKWHLRPAVGRPVPCRTKWSMANCSAVMSSSSDQPLPLSSLVAPMPPSAAVTIP
jgi:hypothetical protein